MSDLVERLRFKSVHLHNPMSLCAEAADEITRLTQEVERLRAGLATIADPKLLKSWGDPMVLRDYARAALSPAPTGGQDE
jgi:hypothetical protein